LPRASPARPPRRPRPPRVELARQVGLGARLEHLPKLGGGHASPSPVLSTVLRCWPTSDGRPALGADHRPAARRRRRTRRGLGPGHAQPWSRNAPAATWSFPARASPPDSTIRRRRLSTCP
jgi:hypothetical protein